MEEEARAVKAEVAWGREHRCQGKAEAYLGWGSKEESRRTRVTGTENAVTTPCSRGSEQASPAMFIARTPEHQNARTSSPEAVGSTLDVRIGKGLRMPWLGQTAGRHMLYHKPGSPKKPSAEGTTPTSVTMATSRAGERS